MADNNTEKQRVQELLLDKDGNPQKEEVERADLEAKQAEFRENYPDVVADFRARQKKCFIVWTDRVQES